MGIRKMRHKWKLPKFPPCMMKRAKARPIPYPSPCGFDRPCAAAAARSVCVSLKYTNESVNHVSMTLLSSGVVVLRVSKVGFGFINYKRAWRNLENLPDSSFKMPAVQISKQKVFKIALKRDWSYFGSSSFPELREKTRDHARVFFLVVLRPLSRGSSDISSCFGCNACPKGYTNQTSCR